MGNVFPQISQINTDWEKVGCSEMEGGAFINHREHRVYRGKKYRRKRKITRSR